MENQYKLLLVLLVASCTTNLLAMRRTVALLSATRSFGTYSGIPHPKWRENSCYLQLKAQPNSAKTHAMLEGESHCTLQTLLRVATYDKDITTDALIALLHAGANINKADIEGQTPLHLLAQNSKNYSDETFFLPLLAHIAKFKPNFEARDEHGKIPADYADPRFKELFKAHEPICDTKLRYLYRHG